MLENLVVKSGSTDDAWLKWYDIMTKEIKESKSRDGEVVNEVLNAVTVIENPTKNIMTNTTRKLSMRYAIGEMLWYLSANNDVKEISKYTSAWERMSDDGETVNSNYGWGIKKKYGFDQYEYVKDLLMKDSQTRQAVIHIKEPRNTLENPTKDLNCTVCLQFFVREGKLYMTTYMRSNDLWMGFPYDVFQFTCLQVLLSMELGLELGTYTHIAGSLHLYKRDYEKSLKNIGE